MISTDVLRNEERVAFALRGLYRSYGYLQYRMSKFEEYDLYVRNKSYLPAEHIITFPGSDGKLMALKPDVTLSIVRTTKDLPVGVQKVYYHENVYRSSGENRSIREMMQVGLECIGNVDAYCVREVLHLAEQSLATVSPDSVLDVSHLGILSEVLLRAGITPENRGELLGYIAEKNPHDLTAFCGKLGLPEENTEWLRQMILCEGEPKEVLPRLQGLFPDPEWNALVEEFGKVLSGLPQKRLRVDFSVINDMSYYNGILFQGFVAGVPNSVLSGGQYDLLMQRMGKHSRAIGFAVYLDQLEQIGQPEAGYDFDVLILYGENTDPAEVEKTVRKYTAKGLRVLASVSLPEQKTWEKLIRLEGEQTK